MTKNSMEYYQRHIYHDLIEWSNRATRKPLILRGARQVGKTTVIKHFGESYDCFLTLNLDIKRDRDLFEQDYPINALIAAIHFHLKQPMAQQGRTLLFIDEIQSAPKAAAMLRYFHEDRSDIHVIAAGSLLETLIDRHLSFPVGRVEYLWMYPLSFPEYLLAANEQDAHTALTTHPCPAYAHERLMTCFHQYTLVGGMPEAVTAYLQNQDILASNAIYRQLMTAFMDDVEKYAHNDNMAQAIRHVIAQAPLASGSRIRFQGFGHSNYRSREMGEALRTLEKAMLLQLVYPSTHTQLPAEINQRKAPKLQFLDIGMVNFSADLQTHYFTNQSLDRVHMGRIIESMVGQELLATYERCHQQLKFWVKESNQANAEIDYVVPFNEHLIPIEVKSGKTGALRSLMQYMALADHPYAVRIYGDKMHVDHLQTPSKKPFMLLNLPYYLTSQLAHYLQWLTEQQATNHS